MWLDLLLVGAGVPCFLSVHGVHDMTDPIVPIDPEPEPAEPDPNPVDPNSPNIPEYMTEDDLALCWGAIQVQLYASAVDEPNVPTMERLARLEELASQFQADLRIRWGRVSARRPVDHQYRPTSGNPTRCVVQTESGGCGQSPDVHTTGGGLSDVLAANQVYRREGVTRTTQSQPRRNG